MLDDIQDRCAVLSCSEDGHFNLRLSRTYTGCALRPTWHVEPGTFHSLCPLLIIKPIGGHYNLYHTHECAKAGRPNNRSKLLQLVGMESQSKSWSVEYEVQTHLAVWHCSLSLQEKGDLSSLQFSLNKCSRVHAHTP